MNGSTSNLCNIKITTKDMSHYYDWALEHCTYDALIVGFISGFALCFFVPLFNFGLRFLLELLGVWQWVITPTLPLIGMLSGVIVAKLVLRWRKKYVQHYKRNGRKEK